MARFKLEIFLEDKKLYLSSCNLLTDNDFYRKVIASTPYIAMINIIIYVVINKLYKFIILFLTY